MEHLSEGVSTCALPCLVCSQSWPGHLPFQGLSSSPTGHPGTPGHSPSPGNHEGLRAEVTAGEC